MMDRLKQAIADLDLQRRNTAIRLEALEAQIVDLTRKRDEVAATIKDFDIELRALRTADTLRPVRDLDPDLVITANDGTVVVAEIKKNKGRQQGALSTRWKEALSDLHAAGNQPVTVEQFYLLTRARTGGTEASVRERIRKYVADGIMMEVSGRYCVSAATIERYGWEMFVNKEKAPTDDAAGLKNGATSVSTAGVETHAD